MSSDAPALRAELVRASRAMHAAGLVTATTGNVSARCVGGMLITPTRRYPDDLHPDEIVRLALDGRRLDAAGREPSLEWPMHAAVYRARVDIAAIAHTHSPHAVARSFDPRPLIVETEERTYLGLDRIEVAAHAPAGSAQLARNAAHALGRRRAVLLARHGVLATGIGARDAVEICHAVEHQAQIEGWRGVAQDRGARSESCRSSIGNQMDLPLDQLD